MHKTGKVEIKKSPSILTGKPSVKIEDGEPLAKSERLPRKSMKKLARSL